MTDMHYSWKISTAAMSQIIPQVCAAITESLRCAYMRTPDTTREWIAIAQRFESKSHFPNALGALDGKHIVMNKPWQAGSQYHNYKGTESINLMALCSADYRFVYDNKPMAIDCMCSHAVYDIRE